MKCPICGGRNPACPICLGNHLGPRVEPRRWRKPFAYVLAAAVLIAWAVVEVVLGVAR